jgi:Ca-activated chloride channel family protein
MSGLQDTFYHRLNLPRDATAEEVRRAYYLAARTLHPDVNEAPDAVEKFLKVKEAFDVLSDPKKRRVYDQKIPPLEMEWGLNFDSLTSRNVLYQTEEPQLVYVLIDLAKPESINIEKEPPPVNLCLVIDRSNSMQGRRMDRVKQTVRKLVNQLRNVDYLSIVAFSDKAEVILPASRNLNQSRVDARVSLLRVGGGTEIHSGLKAGLGQLNRFLRPNYINHMILITDGRTYGDEEKCMELAEEALERGITISSLGIGDEWNDTFLDSLSSKTGGSSVYVAEAHDIRRFMELKFSSLNQIYAEKVRMVLDMPENVTLAYAFRFQPDPTRLDVGPQITAGSVHLNDPLSLLLELRIEQTQEARDAWTFLSGHIEAEIPAKKFPSNRMIYRFSLPVQEIFNQEEPPPKIVGALSRLTLYRMQEQARVDVEEGNVEKATRRLKNLATNLLESGNDGLATMVLTEVSQLERGITSDDGLHKDIKYGTRALLLPAGEEDHQT